MGKKTEKSKFDRGNIVILTNQDGNWSKGKTAVVVNPYKNYEYKILVADENGNSKLIKTKYLKAKVKVLAKEAVVLTSYDLYMKGTVLYVLYDDPKKDYYIVTDAVNHVGIIPKKHIKFLPQ